MTGTRTSVGALLAALLAACVAFQLNASMLSPALVTIERQLGTDAAAVGLTQTAFFTSAALFSLFLPRLGDILGRRKVLTAMLAVMAVGCVVAALAPSVEVLFVGRVVQGVSGPVVPLCLIMLRVEVAEPRRYGTLMGVVTAVNGGVAGVDALAGGYLAGNHGFASVFWTMAVVAVLAAVLVAVLAPESTARDAGEPAPRMDWTGVALLVVSVGALLVALDEAGALAEANWLLVAGLTVLAAVAFAAFWRVEDRTEAPLVATALLRRRATWSLLLTTVLTMTGVFAVMNGLVPALAQDAEAGFGMDAGVAAWWTLTPYALAGLLMGPLAGRLAAGLGYRRVLRAGMVGAVAGILLLLLTATSGSPAALLAVSVVIGLAYAGTANIVLNGLGVLLSPRENPGYLPGLNAGAFNLGSGLSFVVVYAASAVGSYRGGLVAGLVVLALALAASFLIPRPREAEAA